MCQPFVRFVAAMTLTCAATIFAFGQADVSSATIKGTVTDQQGAAIAGASVTAKNLEQGTSRSDTTNANGEFQILALRPGAYEISVKAQGFAQYLIKDSEVTVGQTANYSIKLDIAKVTNEVTVTSTAPLIEVERTQQSNTIESRQIQNLPNIGRDFTSYVFTLPGVSSSSAPRVQAGTRFTFGSSGFSIGGSNGRNNLITVDGGENEYGSGQLRFGISPEAVQEFQVNRNSFNAEFGFTAGTAVNVVTKSGTNDLHGSGYLYFRSDKTSAKERFIPTAFRNQRAFQQQVYPGFTLGGPIVKNKLFFFTNYERQKQDLPRFRSFSTNAQTQPTVLQGSLLTKIGALPDANLQRIAATLRGALTTSAQTFPKSFGLLQANDGIINAPYRLNNWISRLDLNIGQSDTLSLRFSLAHNFNSQLTTDTFESQSYTTTLTVRDYTGLAAWTHNFGGSLVNQFRAQFSPNGSAVTAPITPGTSALRITGVGDFNRPFTTPFETYQDRFQWEDVMTWLTGNHSVKFGGSYRPVNYRVTNALWFNGEWTFSGGVYPLLAVVPALLPSATDQALLGGAVCTVNNRPATDCASTATLSGLLAGTQLSALQSFNFGLPFLYRQGFNNPTWTDWVHFAGFFIQDSWKVNQRLSLDLGVRYDYDGEPKPIPVGHYVSPRFGFSFDVTGDKKTILRGGGGLFYSPVYYQIAYLTNVLNDSGNFINQVFRSPAFPATQTPAAIWAAGVAKGKLPFGAIDANDLAALGISTGPKSVGRVVFELDPDYKANYSVQANLGLQRQIYNDLSVEIAYQMYRGVNLQQPVPRNYCEAGTPGCTPTAANAVALQTRNQALFGPLYQAIDPTITQLTTYTSRGNSIYHGMTVSATKRFNNNFSFQGSYTWSKTIDDVTDFGSQFYAPFPTRLYLERGLSTFDIRHNFIFSGVFRTPWKDPVTRDITLSPIVFIRSGIPFNIVTGTDINADTRNFNDRIFYIGRNTGIGPNFRSFDLRFTKGFRFKADSAARLEFLIEGVNLLNRTNFASVRDIIPATVDATGKLTEPDYNAGTVRLEGRRDRNSELGQPLSFQSAFDPRRIQFGLKLIF
ncbi:MAG: TonB-dependent receptor [Acidobacteria bacterium]|nr:TonB-dependent receptor [Acidobacteriota bacterium]